MTVELVPIAIIALLVICAVAAVIASANDDDPMDGYD